MGVSWEDSGLSGMENSLDHTSRLLALIVHELRAPAGVVSGYLRMLTKSRAMERSSPDLQMVEDASKTCARILRLVQEIDDLSNLDDPAHAPALERVPLFVLCEEVVRESAGHGDAVSFECADGERASLVQGGPADLKRAVAALLAFTVREHGKLAVQVTGFLTGDGADQSVVIAFCRKDGGSVRSDVLTSQSTEFNRWRGGMGLVVPLACRIVEFHGGRVWSLPGTPAACALKLPLASA
jgi:signal transduction histidine kinase